MLDNLTDIADGRLEAPGQIAVLDQLSELEHAADRPDLAGFAAALRPAVTSAIAVRPARLVESPAMARVRRLERLLLPRPVHRLVLILGSALAGLDSVVGLLVVVALAIGGPNTNIVIGDETIPPDSRPLAPLIAGAGQTVVGILLLAAAVLLVFRRDRTAVRLGRLGLVIGLTAVNIVLGYVNAELVVSTAVLELALLGLFLRYRTRFLRPISSPAAAPE